MQNAIKCEMSISEISRILNYWDYLHEKNVFIGSVYKITKLENYKITEYKNKNFPHNLFKINLILINPVEKSNDFHYNGKKLFPST